MTAREAYEIVKKVLVPGEDILCECCDFGDFFGFGFINDEVDWSAAFRTVYKANGHTSIYNPAEDLDLLDSMKKIPLEEILQGESKYIRMS